MPEPQRRCGSPAAEELALAARLAAEGCTDGEIAWVLGHTGRPAAAAMLMAIAQASDEVDRRFA